MTVRNVSEGGRASRTAVFAFVASLALCVGCGISMTAKIPSGVPVPFAPATTGSQQWSVASENLRRAVGRSVERVRIAKVGKNGQIDFPYTAVGTPRDVRARRGGLSYVDSTVATKPWGPAGLTIPEDSAPTARWLPVAFDNLKWEMEETDRGWAVRVPSIEDPPVTVFYFARREDAQALLQALHDFARARVAHNDLDARFPALAAIWRARDPKPALSDAANRHRVLAEEATRSRDYGRAINEFEAALEADPTWPSGNFNLALLYEAVEDWSEAARYMRRFLLLEPDSREAAAAQEKIILWEDRARREQRLP